MERAWPLRLSAGFMFLVFFFFFFPSEGNSGGCGVMVGGKDEEKCDLPGRSATNGGFDLPAKSHCCYALFEKTRWKHFIFTPFCRKHPWFSCKHLMYATKHQPKKKNE